MSLYFEHANYSLKSNSLNVKKNGVVILLKDLQPIFIPNDEKVDFLKDKGEKDLAWSYPNFDELSNIIENSDNIISLWDQIEHGGYDCWSKTLFDTSSKIVVTIEQSEGYYQNPLIAKVENAGNALGGIIQVAWEQDIVLDKIIYDTWLSIARIDIVTYLKEFEYNPIYLNKIAKLYLNELPEDFKNKVLANCL